MGYIGGIRYNPLPTRLLTSWDIPVELPRDNTWQSLGSNTVLMVDPGVFPWNRQGFQQHKDPRPAKNSAISCVLSPPPPPKKKHHSQNEICACQRTPSWTKTLKPKNRSSSPFCFAKNSMQIPNKIDSQKDPNRFCQETTGRKIFFVFCSTGCSNFLGENGARAMRGDQRTALTKSANTVFRLTLTVVWGILEPTKGQDEMRRRNGFLLGGSSQDL